MTDDIKITRASSDDLPRILQLIGELSAFHGDTAMVTLEQLREIFFGMQPLGTAWVARKNGMIVGYAGVVRSVVVHSGLPRFDIQHLHVIESCRSSGIGKALIMAARDFAIAAGAKGISIGTDPRNSLAQAAYRSMGLQEITDAGPRFWISAGD